MAVPRAVQHATRQVGVASQMKAGHDSGVKTNDERDASHGRWDLHFVWFALSNGVISVHKTSLIAPFRAQARCLTLVSYVRHATASKTSPPADNGLKGFVLRHAVFAREDCMANRIF